MDDKSTGLEIGKVYQFKGIRDQIMTGRLVRISGKQRWCTFGNFTVPPQDVLGEVTDNAR